MTKYKQLVEAADRVIEEQANTIAHLQMQISNYQNRFVEVAGENMESEDAREILRLFAPYAQDKNQLVLLVRALSKLPA